jgi:hypothetical protein
MISIKDQVWHQDVDQVNPNVGFIQRNYVFSKQVYNQVENQIRNKLYNQVSDQVYNQVRIQVRSQVLNQVRD